MFAWFAFAVYASFVAYWMLIGGLLAFSTQQLFVDIRKFLHVRMKTFMTAGEVKFQDVLFADALTSMSKILADSQTMMCNALTVVFANNIYFGGPQCISKFIAPTLASTPYAIRAFQCYLTYEKKNDQLQLVNLGKYVSAFPVIWLSALKSGLAPGEGWFSTQHPRPSHRHLL